MLLLLIHFDPRIHAGGKRESLAATQQQISRVRVRKRSNRKSDGGDRTQAARGRRFPERDTEPT